jgi:hypothetical protein
MTEFTGDAGGARDRALTSEQVIADHADLRAGIGALAGLVADSLGLTALLAEVAAFAVRAIPGADGAGVTWGCAGRRSNGVIPRSRSRTGQQLRSSSTNWRCCWTWRMCTGPTTATKAWMRRSASSR